MNCTAPGPQPASDPSGRTVKCTKFQKELPGLPEPPWPGELGQRIFDNISQDAWALWKEHAKMILNEYRLTPWAPESQEILEKAMEEFFFGEGAVLPPDYVPPPTESLSGRQRTNPPQDAETEIPRSARNDSKG